MSRVAVFYGDHFVLFYAPDNDYWPGFHPATHRARESVYCDTFKLLEVIRKLHAKRIPETVLDTDRFHNVHTDTRSPSPSSPPIPTCGTATCSARPSAIFGSPGQRRGRWQPARPPPHLPEPHVGPLPLRPARNSRRLR